MPAFPATFAEYSSFLQEISYRFSFRDTVSLLLKQELGLEDYLTFDHLASLSHGRLEVNGEERKGICVRDFLVDLAAYYPESQQVRNLEKITQDRIYSLFRKTGNVLFDLYTQDMEKFQRMTPEEEMEKGKILQSYVDERTLHQQALETLAILEAHEKNKSRSIRRDINLLHQLLAMPYKVTDNKYIAARNEFVQRNWKLVLYIAYHYRTLRNQEFLDCIQEGNLALVSAAATFHPAYGYRFSTHAFPRIRSNISYYLKKHSNGIIYESSTIQKARKFYNQLRMNTFARFGKLPTFEELESHIKEPWSSQQFFSEKTLAYLRMRPSPYVAPLLFAGNIQDTRVEQSLDHLIALERKKMFGIALQELDPKKIQIICARYGLRDSQILTLQQLGDMFGTTKENIRVLELRALKKIEKKLALYEKHDTLPLRKRTTTQWYKKYRKQN